MWRLSGSIFIQWVFEIVGNLFYFEQSHQGPIIIASCYRQISADIKIKNYNIKTGINFNIFILIFVENCLKYDAIHDFSSRLRTGSKLADINRYPSHT